MTSIRPTGRTRAGQRVILTIATVLGLSLAMTGAGLASAHGWRDIFAVNWATFRYLNVDNALADGYVLFYKCTEEPGVGTMGQHFVKLPLVEDPAIDARKPEVLVYMPTRHGGYRLVAVEYVTIAEAWHGANGAKAPRVLGQNMLFREAGNRYGLPDFYERHAWIWFPNPRGMFDDWNPWITCRGTGDNGG